MSDDLRAQQRPSALGREDWITKFVNAVVYELRPGLARIEAVTAARKYWETHQGTSPFGAAQAWAGAEGGGAPVAPALRTFQIGLISDTHGMLRPEALRELHGSDYIVHAGDIGSAEVLETLGAIAPLTVARGNNDRDGWCAKLQHTDDLLVGDVRIRVVHDLATLGDGFVADGVRVVVSGHSHAPKVDERDGVLFVNPGSAGPRRFSLPVSVGKLEITGSNVRASLTTLLR